MNFIIFFQKMWGVCILEFQKCGNVKQMSILKQRDDSYTFESKQFLHTFQISVRYLCIQSFKAWRECYMKLYNAQRETTQAKPKIMQIKFRRINSF